MSSRFEIIVGNAGTGGFGVVSKARDNILERDVAIKTLDPIFRTIEANDEERFRREAKILAALNHPNIPAIYDVIFEPEQQNFEIIYAWIEGITITQYLMKNGTLPLDLAKKYFRNICSALTSAHEKGIIHRDIKASNLIITNDKESCYLVDFGISLTTTDVERLTNSKDVVGTPGYMSPEQEANQELTPASDVYSLGIVLYEVLSGNKPKIGEYQPLNTFNEAIPPSIDNLIRDCLKEKDIRIQTPEEFINRLDRALKPNMDIALAFAQGPIHEMIASLKTLNSVSFSTLPIGQRILLHTRLSALVESNEFNLRNPIALLILALLQVSRRVEKKYFEPLIRYSLRYGFDEQYGERFFGNPDLRTELSNIAIDCEHNQHKIFSAQFLEFLDSTKIEDKDHWYKFAVRDIIQNLLANSNCDESTAEELGEKLSYVLSNCYS